MKQRSIFYCCLIASQAFAQSPLDAPGEKTVTVGSEISRGAKEVINSVRSNVQPYLSVTVEQINAVISRNSAKNTDSLGFYLGARASAVILLDVLFKVPATSQANSAQDIASARAAAQKYAVGVRELQKQMGIDDEALCQALGLSGATAQETKSLLASFAPSVQ
jgi:hypothetical protein